MKKPKSFPMLFFFSALAIIAIVTFLGPEEKALGSNVRIVYLHGAWVLTAEIAFLAAALAGVAGLLSCYMAVFAPHKAAFLRWSEALGRTGIIFWISYLPLSLWAMQANWNGLFLAEPRFQLAFTFAVVGVLMQAGLSIINNGVLTAVVNIAYIIVLRVIFATAANIMHPPPSPIFNSGNYLIIGYFIGLNLLTWLAAYFLTRWLLSLSSR